MEAEVGQKAGPSHVAAYAGSAAALDGSRARRALPQPVAILLLTLVLVGCIVFSMTCGAVHVPVLAIVHSARLGAHALDPTEQLILLHIRLPRIVAAALVGAALSVAGLLFQGMFRNPMADPYILGASGGSVLGAGVGIFFFGGASVLGFSAAAVLAFAAAVLTMTVVYLVARRNGRTSTVTLLLAGFALSTLLTNSTYVFEAIDRGSGGVNRALEAWLRGVIGTPQWSQLALTAMLMLLAFVACIPLAARLNTLALGEDYAQQLGVAVERCRVGIIVVGSLLTAMAVALGGLISFAGLIVPHAVRLVFGADNRRLLPLTALAGASVLVLADTLARTVLAPSEIPVGVLMAALGGPFFLYLLRRSRRSYAL